MTASQDRIVLAARSWIGTPYRHQAAVKGAGTDCLGLLRGVWREIYGAEPTNVPAYTPDWSETCGEEKLWRAADKYLERQVSATKEPGDILLFRMRAGSVAKHLGIVSRTNPTSRFIHAYSGHGVIESELTAPWARRVVARFKFPSRGS